MIRTRNCLAFDLGASGGRAIIGRFDGELLALEEVRRSFATETYEPRDVAGWDDACARFAQLMQ